MLTTRDTALECPKTRNNPLKLQSYSLDYYPAEAPEWWRERYSHPNMWKYGIWPQHSTMALDEHMRPKGMRHVHMMDQEELAKEEPPRNAG